jgi:hypothetical protein
MLIVVPCNHAMFLVLTNPDNSCRRVVCKCMQLGGGQLHRVLIMSDAL